MFESCTVVNTFAGRKGRASVLAGCGLRGASSRHWRPSCGGQAYATWRAGLAGVQALGFSLAYCITISSLQFAENCRGEDGHCAQHEERAVNSVNKLRAVGGVAIGNEERGDQRC